MNELRHFVGQAFRKLFPEFMSARDEKLIIRALHEEHLRQLQAMETKVNFTQQQWIDYIIQRYKQITGHDLNLENPRRYTEKMQWRKLFECDPRMTVLSDKYEVREWVKSTIGEEYLIPLIGVWERPEDIDFDMLPDSFVLKTNNACETNIIVRDKKQLNQSIVRETLDYWLKIPFWSFSGEMHYKNIKPRIIAEKYITVEDTQDLPDYKFLCFDGKVYCSYFIKDRIKGHEETQLGIFDRDFNLLPYYRTELLPIRTVQPKPLHYEQMVELAEKLSKGFSHVRVDLYDVNGKIYFGEMTFTNGSGFFVHEPDCFDYILGEQWKMGPDTIGNHVFCQS